MLIGLPKAYQCWPIGLDRKGGIDQQNALDASCDRNHILHKTHHKERMRGPQRSQRRDGKVPIAKGDQPKRVGRDLFVLCTTPTLIFKPKQTFGPCNAPPCLLLQAFFHQQERVNTLSATLSISAFLNSPNQCFHPYPFLVNSSIGMTRHVTARH